MVFTLLIIPFLIAGIPKLVISLTEKEIYKNITLAIIGRAYEKDLISFLEKQEKLFLTFNFDKFLIENHFMYNINRMSKKDQNFKNTPDLKIINLLLETFGLDGLEDDRCFTKNHMKDIQTVENITLLKSQLQEYYIPCKSKIYLQNLNEKKVITILRQFIKKYNCAYFLFGN